MSEATHGKQSSTIIRQADISLIDPPGSASLPPINRVMTVPEVAHELRCSKAHVHNLIKGKVRGAQPLPSLRLGRRCLVRRLSLDEWIRANEQCYDPIVARH
jgi:excisionase family DNA binding protein